MKLRSRSGFTLIELMLASAILAVITVAAVTFIRPALQSYQRGQVRHKANNEARLCMDTITNTLRNGLAKSIVISTPQIPGMNPPANSRIEFDGTLSGSNTTIHYQIYWSTAPLNTVYLRMGNGATQLLANNVSCLGFSTDFRVPSLVSVTLELQVPYDNTGLDDHIVQVSIPAETVRLAENL